LYLWLPVEYHNLLQEFVSLYSAEHLAGFVLKALMVAIYCQFMYTLFAISKIEPCWLVGWLFWKCSKTVLLGSWHFVRFKNVLFSCRFNSNISNFRLYSRDGSTGNVCGTRSNKYPKTSSKNVDIVEKLYILFQKIT